MPPIEYDPLNESYWICNCLPYEIAFCFQLLIPNHMK